MVNMYSRYLSESEWVDVRYVCWAGGSVYDGMRIEQKFGAG
jgi:hypothetical protein